MNADTPPVPDEAPASAAPSVSEPAPAAEAARPAAAAPTPVAPPPEAGPAPPQRFLITVPAVLRPGAPAAAEVAVVDAAGRPVHAFQGQVLLICLTDDGHAETVCRRAVTGATTRLALRVGGAPPDAGVPPPPNDEAGAWPALRIEGAGRAWLVAADLAAGLAGISPPFEIVDAPDAPGDKMVDMPAAGGIIRSGEGDSQRGRSCSVG